ncbi:hypothetical protein AVEN_204663-1 [Araneus ventricosus]|uniref:Uncharacterized protein n=1 Tax=Araneus ventricosus TaxID=182803 RepID=A0A4Y2WGS7_ARAVE|nr:hypothetical protein AVEN_94131-1 [Araneus ventricosus]GBO36814.1 hypothetical protein AVEN_204663-1 [Araneus ventricosus]
MVMTPINIPQLYGSNSRRSLTLLMEKRRKELITDEVPKASETDWYAGRCALNGSRKSGCLCRFRNFDGFDVSVRQAAPGNARDI